jgi:predicted Zn-dependent protease
MQLVIINDFAAAIHSDSQAIADFYPGGLILAVPDDTPVEIGQPWTVDLDAAKTSVCNAIDAEAERRRSLVLTPGAGQMAAYQEKERQARALLQDNTPTEGEYPDIFSEIGITADSAGEVAMAVLAAAEKWRAYGRLVEQARLAGKKAVRQAEDVKSVIAAKNRAVWP